jgi:HPr kinase/phosphorylase
MQAGEIFGRHDRASLGHLGRGFQNAQTNASVSGQRLRRARSGSQDCPMSIHATSIAIAAQGLLLQGPSGAGKSLLALRLIQRGAWLIADDQTSVTVKGGEVWASCPSVLAGKLEVRGVGIVAAPHQPQAPVRLVLDLDPANRPAPDAVRLPEIRPWTPPAGLQNTRPIPCVPFDAMRLDAAEAVIAALAQSRDWEDSPAL